MMYPTISINGKEYFVRGEDSRATATMANRVLYIQRPNGDVIYRIAEFDDRFSSPRKAGTNWETFCDEVFELEPELPRVVVCQICREVIDAEDSYEVLQDTFVCDPDYRGFCLWEWNNRGHVRSEFYD